MKNNKPIVFVSFIILLVLIAGAIVYFSPSMQTSIQRNFEIFSVDSPTITSSNPSLIKPFRIFGKFGGGEQIIGEVSTTRSDYTGKKPIRFSANAIQETAIFSIQASDIISKRDYYAEIEETAVGGTGAPDCDYGYTQILYEDNNWIFGKRDVRHCLKITNIGRSGILQTPNVKYQADVTLSNGDETFTERITSNKPLIEFGDVAIMQLQGALVSGDGLPTTSEYKPILLYNNQWYFISSDDWTNYLARIQAWKSKSGEQITNDPTDEYDLVNYYSNLKNLLNKDIDTILSREVTFAGSNWRYRTSESQASIEYPLDRVFSSQTFTLDVDADWVGIDILSGEPDITNVQCPTFKSADEGNMKVYVQNIGDSQAKFFAQVTGCTPIEQKFSASTDSIDLNARGKSGDDGIINVRLTTGNLNADVSKSCTVKVYDSQDSSNSDTRSVTCRVEKTEFCTEGEQSLNSQNVKCVDECTDSEIKQKFCCGTNQEARLQSTGLYTCQDKDNPEICNNKIDDDGDGFIDKKDTDCGATGGFNFGDIDTISIVTGLSIGLLILASGYFYFVKPKGRKKLDYFLLGLLFLISGLIGFLIYYLLQIALDFIFSWWGLLTGIILISAIIFVTRLTKR